MKSIYNHSKSEFGQSIYVNTNLYIPFISNHKSLIYS